MSQELSMFKNGKFQVRVHEDAGGEIWFVAKDVAVALGYASTNMPTVFQAVPDIWKGSKRIATLGGEQNMLCVTEQGLYFFLGRSDKEAALPYQIWIAKDVVPSIRKTGSYSNEAAKTENVIQFSDASSLVGYDNFRACHFLLKNYGLSDSEISDVLDKIWKRQFGFSVINDLGLVPQKSVPEPGEEILLPSDLGRIIIPSISARAVNRIFMHLGYQFKYMDFYQATEDGIQNGAIVKYIDTRAIGEVPMIIGWSKKVIGILEEYQKKRRGPVREPEQNCFFDSKLIGSGDLGASFSL